VEGAGSLLGRQSACLKGKIRAGGRVCLSVCLVSMRHEFNPQDHLGVGKKNKKK
jgi:hypothetical protein